MSRHHQDLNPCPLQKGGTFGASAHPPGRGVPSFISPAAHRSPRASAGLQPSAASRRPAAPRPHRAAALPRRAAAAGQRPRPTELHGWSSSQRSSLQQRHESDRCRLRLVLRGRALFAGSPRVLGQRDLTVAVVGVRLGRAQRKGSSLRCVHALSFPRPRPVTQPVIPLDFFKGSALEELEHLQREFPLLARAHGPSIVPPELMRLAKSYRDACRLCWALRRVKGMTRRQLAAEAGLLPQHVTDYFKDDDAPTRRDLPASKKDDVEAVLGNTAISQYLARGASFTVLEELQATRRAA